MRLPALVLLSLAAASPAFAGGSSSALPPPDPAAATLTPREIGDRAYTGCLIIQSRLQSKPQETFSSACTCYSKRTIAKMTKDEIAAFRQTGYFDDTTREKALEALDHCRLPRPI